MLKINDDFYAHNFQLMKQNQKESFDQTEILMGKQHNVIYAKGLLLVKTSQGTLKGCVTPNLSKVPYEVLTNSPLA